MSFFGTTLTILVTLLHIYVLARVASLPALRRPLIRRIAIGIGIALWLVFLVGEGWGGRRGDLLSVTLETAAMHWMASVFLLAVGFLMADLVTGFGVWFRSAVAHLRAAGLAAGVLCVVVAQVQGLRAPVVETYDVVVEGLSPDLDGTRIAVMADTHVGEILVGARWLDGRVSQVQALQPDLIVLAGDMFERRSDPAELAPVMQRLHAPLGVWAVRGNHDSMRPNRRDVAGEILAGAGIRLLSNQWVEVGRGLVLAGIDDLTSSRRRPGEGERNLARALADRPDRPTLLVSHTPWLTARAAAAGVDIMLSGHTHDGQIWPFGYLVRTRYPFVGGRYDVDGMTLIVSRGTGTWGPRMRLWAASEISLVTLRNSGSSHARAPE